ncbi:hypothetical protein ACROYT_G016052 [Oculina patagonica]
MCSRNPTPTVLEYAYLYGPTMKENVKQLTKCGFHYLTARSSFYELPEENCLSIGEIPSIPQMPLKSMPPVDQKILCDWRDNYGQSVPQVTVRNQYTKDDVGTLPVYSYTQPAPTPQPLTFITSDSLETSNANDSTENMHIHCSHMPATAPKGRVWRKQGEGLEVTAKGSKNLAGGRILHVMVAVAYGKGVILKDVYDKLNGCYFSQLIRTHFNSCFASAGPKRNGNRVFVMDNDPSQTSRLACQAMEEVEAELHTIPPRSPDLNPIENIFHVLRKIMDQEVQSHNITYETFEEFKERVLRTLDNIDIELIDKTIANMSERIDSVVAGKGRRTKY